MPGFHDDHRPALCSQSNSATTGLADGTIADQFDAGFIQSRNEFGEGFDIAPDDAFAGFHSLDRRQGKIGKFRELALIDTDQRASSPELSCSYHASDIESHV